LKAVDSVGILYGNSLHFLSFQHLPVKSDNICKRAPEINAKTVFSAWFQAHLLTAIAEGPAGFISDCRRPLQTRGFSHFLISVGVRNPRGLHGTTGASYPDLDIPTGPCLD